MVNGGRCCVGHEAGTLRGESEVDLSAATGAERPFLERYDLAIALSIVRRLETSPGRGAVFEEIKAKNALYRVVDAIYAGLGPLRPLALLAYMLKSVLAVGPFKSSNCEAVSISNFDNEHRAIDRVAAMVPEARISQLTLKRRHILSLSQLRAAIQMLVSVRRTWTFLSRLVRLHSFMPSARIASTLAFYMRFLQYFADHPRVRTAIVPSNYSPEGIGLAAAAHRSGRRVIYINHAPVPANSALMPPVLADCAIFYGDAVRKTYERRSRCVSDVALVGQPWTSRPMAWRDTIERVGIFLTAGTNRHVVSDLVAAIRASHPAVHVLIRNHPVALLKADFSDLAAQDGNLTATIGNPLDEEIAACDLIICGNSGVALNAASGGRPVAYINALDRSGFDYNGFVESGLIFNVHGWTPGLYAELKAFYDRPEWRAVMRSYDASYEADPDALRRSAAEIVRKHLVATPGPALPTR